MKWRTFNGEQILSIKDAVEQAIVREQKAGNRLKVCIGTDSQVYSSNTEFATVIVFLREKHRIGTKPHEFERKDDNRSSQINSNCLRAMRFT